MASIDPVFRGNLVFGVLLMKVGQLTTRHS
jgi:hypothetical protein